MQITIIKKRIQIIFQTKLIYCFTLLQNFLKEMAAISIAAFLLMTENLRGIINKLRINFQWIFPFLQCLP
jgi:hypothetical protein